MHKSTDRFWKYYHALPQRIQKTANKNFQILKDDIHHPSLQFKKVGKFWSARVGIDYRALAVEQDHGFTWVWIGSHEEYDKLLSK
jgi:hypothetical protein